MAFLTWVADHVVLVVVSGVVAMCVAVVFAAAIVAGRSDNV